MEPLSYLHPIELGTDTLPEAFTFPFRYTPHSLCRRAALIVQAKLREMGVTSGKMYGVLVVKKPSPMWDEPSLYFMAAYSGQLRGSYNYPWFVPPVVDYLDPQSHFQQVQKVIDEIGQRIALLKASEERRFWQQKVQDLRNEKEVAVAEAKRVYGEGKMQRKAKREEERMRRKENGEEGMINEAEMIRESQQQKADIQRAKQLHKEEIAELESRLTEHNRVVRNLYEERRQRSEALQQWLFEQFVFLNGRGEKKGLLEIFTPPPCTPREVDSSQPLDENVVVPPIGRNRERLPSGAGECCAPKLLQAAYQLGLEPLAMGEFWWGDSAPGHYRQPGAFFPACRSKCYPILGHMLQGLNVEPDPAEHYDNRVLAPVRVLWEDEDLAVVLKPEGWVSIPGKSDQACLLDECFRFWPDITGSVVVHRLDQDTSGVMVIAKNARVHRALSQQFERREVHKRYVALIEREEEKEGTSGLQVISLPLGPDLDNMPHQQVDFENGKEAITHYEVQGVEECWGRKVTRVVFYPQTGRTHQLRVHSAAPEGLNAPILGDRLYGNVADRLYLHAEALDFVHPLTHEPMHFEVPAPF